MTKLTTHEALIWVMITTSASDHAITERELEQVGELVSGLPVFSGFTGSIPKTADACLEHLKDENGLSDILDRVTESLPPALRETAYALAVEVAATDLLVRQEELLFLQMLEDAFALPKLSVAAIEFSARVRFRKAP